MIYIAVKSLFVMIIKHNLKYFLEIIATQFNLTYNNDDFYNYIPHKIYE